MDRAMKIAHFTTFSPNRSGLYETTRDMVVAQNRLGIDSAIVPSPVPPDIKNTMKMEKRPTPIRDFEWAKDADIHVLHSIIPDSMLFKKPTIYINHGMPEAALFEDCAYDGV